MPLPLLRLKIVRRSRHPWVYRKMIEKPDVLHPPGSLVEVVDREGKFVGRGHYNRKSEIGLRLLTEDPDEPIDADFFRRRLEKALELRRNLLRLDEVTDAYRVAHAEADGLSGLVIDRFGPAPLTPPLTPAGRGEGERATLAVEYFSAGMHAQRGDILEALDQVFPGSTVFEQADERAQELEGFTLAERIEEVRTRSRADAGTRRRGTSRAESRETRERSRPSLSTLDSRLSTSVTITEHGVRFRVWPGSRHKTGFFLDQRDNRRRFAELVRGGRVLDLCTNTGGFAIYAKALGGAREVIGIDLDEEAIDRAKQNANLNQLRIRFTQADLFPYLRELDARGERFDAVVLDPSSQARRREDVPEALARYSDMNRLALKVVAPGGVFLTCSCTGLVDEPNFLEMLRRAAGQAGRSVQVFAVAGAAPDHPFLIHVPEGRYLKAAFCRVV